MNLGAPIDIRRADEQLLRAERLRDGGLVKWVEAQLPRRIEGLTPAVRADVERVAGRIGLPLSLHSEAATFAATRDAAVRSRLRDTLVETIELAGRVAAPVITLHPPLAAPAAVDGMTGGRWTEQERALLKDSTADQPQAEAWFRELLLGVVDEARAAGTVIAIENMRTRGRDARLNFAGEIARLVAEIDRPEIRTCLDVRKVYREGIDICALIARLGALIANVHAAGVGAGGKPGAVGEGGVEWPAVCSALRGAGYDGPVIYEGPMEAAEDSLAALSDALSGRTPSLRTV